MGRQHPGIFGAQVPSRLQDLSLSKTGLEEFLQEGHAFLGPADSLEPVGGSQIRRLPQNQFGSVEPAAGTQNSRQLEKNLFAKGI